MSNKLDYAIVEGHCADYDICKDDKGNELIFGDKKEAEIFNQLVCPEMRVVRIN